MTRKIRGLILAGLLVVGLAPAAAAQTGGVLTGVVYDRAGNPVPGVVLTIVATPQRTTRVVVTDLRGVYFVDRLDYGTPYTLDVSHPRFRKARVHASANEGETPIHIALQPRQSRLARLGRFSLRLLRFGMP